MSELNKTIEQLEAEIMAEMSDPQTQSAQPADPMPSVSGEKEDLGNKPENANKRMKKVKDAQTRSAQSADGMKTISASYELEEKKKMKEEEDMEDDEEEMDDEEDMEEEVDMEDDDDMEDDEEGDEEEMTEKKKKMKKESFEDRLSQIDVSEDVEALTKGQNLSEEFKEKASVIFEAAVKSKVKSEVHRIMEESEVIVESYIDEFKNELSEKVDKYLEYVVEQWMNENQLAVERGLKGEIAEDFISGLKDLFQEHYIDIPDEKYDVLESQANQLETLEEKLNEQIEANVNLNRRVSQYIRESILNDVTSDLTDTETEKFSSLTEDLEFIDEDAFRFKLNALKESYFPKVKKTISESVDYDQEIQDYEVTGTMAKYLKAISTTKSKF